MKYVVENQGLPREGWKVDIEVLQKVKDIDWVAFFLCALESM